MQKFLILLVGIFIGNALMNFRAPSSSLPNTEEIKSAISGEFKKLPHGESKAAVLDAEKIKKAQTQAKEKQRLQIKNLKTEDMSAEVVEKEISEYFGEEELDEDDVNLGSAYRAEVRQESRELQKKLIRQ